MIASTIDDGGVVLRDRDLLGPAEHRDGDVLKLDAEVFGDHLAAGQDSDVLQHGLAAVAEARSLHGRNLQAAAQLVDHERSQSLAFDVLGNDEQRTAGLHDCLKHGQQRLQVRQLLLVDQDVGIVEIDAHLLGIGDEVGRDIAAVELHAFHGLQARSQATWLPRR